MGVRTQTVVYTFVLASHQEALGKSSAGVNESAANINTGHDNRVHSGKIGGMNGEVSARGRDGM